jgi:tRNA pseudouridine38-40 synthase
MPRYRITIEYDGAPFVGWQAQAEGIAIQTALEDAIFRFSGERTRIKGAGRTDAGVHALGQVAHFDLPTDRAGRAWAPGRIREAINFHLKPAPVCVLDCTEAPATFDARFSASGRHYLYRILCRRAPPVLDRGRVWWLKHALDAGRMAEAARTLVGRHDFTTFRAQACQAKSPVRTLDRLDVTHAGVEIEIRASARSFLHNQVRSMVGSLKLVGEGKWTPADLAAALAARDRSACGPVAPPQGLYLLQVDYADPLRGFETAADDEPVEVA